MIKILKKMSKVFLLCCFFYSCCYCPFVDRKSPCQNLLLAVVFGGKAMPCSFCFDSLSHLLLGVANLVLDRKNHVVLLLLMLAI